MLTYFRHVWQKQATKSEQVVEEIPGFPTLTSMIDDQSYRLESGEVVKVETQWVRRKSTSSRSTSESSDTAPEDDNTRKDTNNNNDQYSQSAPTAHSDKMKELTGDMLRVLKLTDRSPKKIVNQEQEEAKRKLEF